MAANPYQSPTVDAREGLAATELPPELLARATTLLGMGVAKLLGAAAFAALALFQWFRLGVPAGVVPLGLLGLAAANGTIAAGLVSRRPWGRYLQIADSACMLPFGAWIMSLPGADLPARMLTGSYLVALHGALLLLLLSPATRDVCGWHPQSLRGRGAMPAVLYKTLVFAVLWSLALASFFVG